MWVRVLQLQTPCSNWANLRPALLASCRMLQTCWNHCSSLFRRTFWRETTHASVNGECKVVEIVNDRKFSPEPDLSDLTFHEVAELGNFFSCDLAPDSDVTKLTWDLAPVTCWDLWSVDPSQTSFMCVSISWPRLTEICWLFSGVTPRNLLQIRHQSVAPQTSSPSHFVVFVA